MALERMPIRNPGMVEVVLWVARHSQLIHDSAGRKICGNREGDHLGKLKLLKGDLQRGLGTLGSQTLSPAFRLESPTDFHRRRGNRWQGEIHSLDSDHADEGGGFAHLRGKKAEAVLLIHLPEESDGGIALLASEQSEKKPADTRVRVHFRKGRQIGIPPRPQTQPFSLDHADASYQRNAPQYS